MTREDVFAKLETIKIIALIRANPWELAYEAGLAAAAAGFEAIELTFTTDNCEKAIIQLKEEHPEVLVGAGTIRSIIEGERALDCGADFFVSPHLDEEIAKAFEEEPYIPGVFTPSEIMSAHRFGFQWMKIFPGQTYGVAGIKSLLGPYPNLKFMVTGGVNSSNFEDFLNAGAKAVAAGTSLFSKEVLEKRDWDYVKTEAKRWGVG